MTILKVYLLINEKQKVAITMMPGKSGGMTDEFPVFPKRVHVPLPALTWQNAAGNKWNVAEISFFSFHGEYVAPNPHFS